VIVRLSDAWHAKDLRYAFVYHLMLSLFTMSQALRRPVNWSGKGIRCPENIPAVPAKDRIGPTH